MGHKCFISFKMEDIDYKNEIQSLEIDMIDKSLNEEIDSNDEDYVMRRIREDYLYDSTVTIFLIGNASAENLWFQNQSYIKRELQASLYTGKYCSKNGILGIVLPSMYQNIYKGSGICFACGNSHNYVSINENTVIKEFSYNYYIPNNKCAWSDEDRYCVLIKWDDFIQNPEKYIEQAFDKRSHPIASKTKVRP